MLSAMCGCILNLAQNLKPQTPLYNTFETVYDILKQNQGCALKLLCSFILKTYHYIEDVFHNRCPILSWKPMSNHRCVLIVPCSFIPKTYDQLKNASYNQWHLNMAIIEHPLFHNLHL
jgi:hypothetical protein